MHSPFSIMDVNTTWNLDMERIERQLARKLKANTPSDAVIAQIEAERHGRGPIAVVASAVVGAWQAVATRRQAPDAAPVPHR